VALEVSSSCDGCVSIGVSYSAEFWVLDCSRTGEPLFVIVYGLVLVKVSMRVFTLSMNFSITWWRLSEVTNGELTPLMDVATWVIIVPDCAARRAVTMVVIFCFKCCHRLLQCLFDCLLQ
jgi:hypothetical protein